MNNNTTQIDDALDTVDPVYAWEISFALLLSLSVVGIIGNVLVITVIVLVKAMRTTVNFCLGCLAAVDLFVLVVEAANNSIWLSPSNAYRYYQCALRVMRVSCLVCSHLIFLLIGVERYSLLCHPLKSLGWWTLKKACLAIVIICVVSAGVALPYGVSIRYGKEESFINKNITYDVCEVQHFQSIRHYLTTVICVASFLPIFLLIWLYSKMIIAMRAKVPERSGVREGTTRGRTKSRSEAVVMLAVVVTVFVICILPYEIWMLLKRYAPGLIIAINDETFWTVESLIHVLLYVNHTSNPIVYFLMSASFRQAFKSVFCRCHRLRQGHAV